MFFGYPKNAGFNSDVLGTFAREDLVPKGHKGFPVGLSADWTAIKSGFWSDPSIWRKGGVNTGSIPGVIQTDNVTIPKNCTVFQNVNPTINNITNYGYLVFASGATFLQINGTIKSYGTIDLSGAAYNLRIATVGTDSYINPNRFICGASSTTTFNNTSNPKGLIAPLFPLTYRNVVNSSITAGLVCFVGDVVILGTYGGSNSTATTIFDSFTIYGTCSIPFSGYIAKGNNSGRFLFKGSLSLIGNSGIYMPTGFSVELEAGFSRTAGTAFYGETGFKIITNSQQFSGAAGIDVGSALVGSIIIDAGLTLTHNFSGGSFTNGILDGVDSASSFVNNTTFNHGHTTKPMVTGLFSSPGTFVYTKTGAQTVREGTYGTLTLQGTGVKTLAGNIICTTFNLKTAATIDFNGFTITCTNANYVLDAAQNTIYGSANVIATNVSIDGYVDGNSGKTLVGNISCTNLTFSNRDFTLIFNGFTITVSGTTTYSYTANQRVWGTANIPTQNLALGGGGNKTLQGNVSVPGTYSVTGTAVKVDNGFIFGNP